MSCKDQQRSVSLDLQSWMAVLCKANKCPVALILNERHQEADDNLDSKWLEFCADNGGPAWLEYRLLPGNKPAAVLRYVLAAAGDSPEHEPCGWVLEGEPADTKAAASSGGALQEPYCRDWICKWQAGPLIAEAGYANGRQARCRYAYACCRCAGCWLELDRRVNIVIQAEGKAKAFKVPRTALCRCAACCSLPSLSSDRLRFSPTQALACNTCLCM